MFTVSFMPLGIHKDGAIACRDLPNVLNLSVHLTGAPLRITAAGDFRGWNSGYQMMRIIEPANVAPIARLNTLTA